MDVADLMQRNVPSAAVDLPLCRLAERMKRHRVDHLPVVKESAIVGQVSARDLITQSVAKGHDPLAHCVGDIMRKEIFTAYADESIEEAADCMRTNGVDWLLVLDVEGRVVGSLSIADIAMRWKDHAMVGEIIESVHRTQRKRGK